MDYSTLKTEIGLPAYAGMTDEQLVGTLNAMTVPAPATPVRILVVMTYLRENGLWLPIKAAAAAGTVQGAVAAVDFNDDLRTETLDFSQGIVRLMLADLVTHALLTQAQADALVALGTPPIPYLATIGWPVPVSVHDVAAARNLMS